ncbi:alpha/beta hydrolase family protein [Flammeovirga kamogawensis]|uniref:Lysophospholipase n=1 Tax=Flammeovirga kamogawensis TaxID=373891 RepID=A0ABX8H4T3_9BACT|nr:alpha/beta fold hydrolase [Flammeovirga kamogawensis]MBB6463536.1 putative redox protein [Flammeovirga kamogawensis]QWG10592.1 lysophospholipase [Flammeovirga kamogawensis]TRX63698.1 lysophospholipase [Flammeovirga kamogawensis]
MKSINLKIKNSSGITLSSKLELPENRETTTYAIFAHCFTCSKNLNAVTNIAKALNSMGIAVLRFDFTGLGQSGGDFSETDFSSNVQDLIDVASYLAEEYHAPKLMIGHSLGGAAAIYAGKQIASIKAIATVGAPSSPHHVQHLFQHSIDEILEKGKALVQLGGRGFTISKQFIEDISNTNMKELMDTLRKPIIILHSPQDTTVDIKNAAEIYGYAHHPKSFISLDGADHLLTDSKYSNYVGKMIAQWVTIYLE